MYALAGKVTHFCFILLSFIDLGSIIGGSIGGLILIISIIIIVGLWYYCCKCHKMKG